MFKGYQNNQSAVEQKRVRREANDEWTTFNVSRYVELVIVNDFKVVCILSNC